MSFLRNTHNAAQRNAAAIKAKEKTHAEYSREIESTIFYFDMQSYYNDAPIRDFCFKAISELEALQSKGINIKEISARCAILRDEFTKLSESVCSERKMI